MHVGNQTPETERQCKSPGGNSEFLSLTNRKRRKKSLIDIANKDK
jgi:hypothetical protein